MTPTSSRPLPCDLLVLPLATRLRRWAVDKNIAIRIGVIVATAAAGTAAATATATHCPWFAFARGLFGLGVPSGSDARISAAIGRPTTNGPTALSAAPRRASRAYVH